jgi:6 kDa early secretory antigenic target
MGEISVRFDALQGGEQGIRNNYSKLTATLEQLNSDLQPMINSWSGDARDAYMQCKKQWDDASQALAQVLNSVAQAVGQANQNYQGAESAARSNWA